MRIKQKLIVSYIYIVALLAEGRKRDVLEEYPTLLPVIEKLETSIYEWFSDLFDGNGIELENIRDGKFETEELLRDDDQEFSIDCCFEEGVITFSRDSEDFSLQDQTPDKIKEIINDRGEFISDEEFAKVCMFFENNESEIEEMMLNEQCWLMNEGNIKDDLDLKGYNIKVWVGSDQYYCPYQINATLHFSEMKAKVDPQIDKAELMSSVLRELLSWHNLWKLEIATTETLTPILHIGNGRVIKEREQDELVEIIYEMLNATTINEWEQLHYFLKFSFCDFEVEDLEKLRDEFKNPFHYEEQISAEVCTQVLSKVRQEEENDD